MAKSSKKNNVTMTDVARRAGVSQSTVSRTFNGSNAVDPEKKELILAAAAELNYRPNVIAQGLVMGKTSTIGVVTRYLGSPFFGNVLEGVEHGIKEHKFFPIVVTGGATQQENIQAIETLLSRRVDGLLFLINDDPIGLDYLQDVSSHTPIIVVGHEIAGFEDHCITVKNYEAGYAATQHLIKKGHTIIAHLAGPAPDALRRRDGYINALQDAGLTVYPELILKADFSEAEAYMMGEELLNLRQKLPFTAVFTSNDQMAIGFRLALHRYGLSVPDDVSLIGFDDIPSAKYMTPPLTTMRQPIYQLGYTASQVLFSVIEGNSPRPMSFPVELIERETVKSILP